MQKKSFITKIWKISPNLKSDHIVYHLYIRKYDFNGFNRTENPKDES